MWPHAEALTDIAPDRCRVVDVVPPDVEVDKLDEGHEPHPEDV